VILIKEIKILIKKVKILIKNKTPKRKRTDANKIEKD